MAILRIRDADGNIHEIQFIKGSDYVLTNADKQEIASMVSNMISIPSAISLDDYAKTEDIPDVSNFVTEEQVQTMIKNAIANGSVEVVIIDFSIEDFKFQAEEGMTWREWVNSKYNSDGACVYNEGNDTVCFVEYSLNVLASNIPVKGSDTIKSGYFYYLS